MSLPGDRTRDRSSFSPLQRSLAGVLRIYQQVISPLLPSACRFYPTCSQYMHDAVLSHGSARGVWLGLRRLAKCHPFHPGGVDPVPAKNATHSYLELNERT